MRQEEHRAFASTTALGQLASHCIGGYGARIAYRVMWEPRSISRAVAQLTPLWERIVKRLLCRPGRSQHTNTPTVGKAEYIIIKE